MKRLLPGIAALTCSLWGMSQAVTDTVSIGAGYANQVWYSLESGILETADKSEWDLAFEANGFSSSIRINGASGTRLYTYPHGDTSAWNTVDTTGMAGWIPLFNSDTSWALGAFNVNANPGNTLDLGWGIYNMTTHHVVGDSIYVLKTASGTYKKLWVVSLASGTYTFRMAELDGSNEVERTLVKGAFPDKHFGYYSIAADQVLNREPIHSNWELLFTQYAALIPGFGAYPSTGVLQNSGVSAAKVYPVNDPETHDDHASANFSTEINTIGYTWKSINMTTFEWEIADSTVYFVQGLDGDIWKLIMKGFGGSANGNYIFSKEKMTASGTGITDVARTPAVLQLYPNPAANGMVTVVYDLRGARKAQLQVYDLQGRVRFSEPLEGPGLQTHPVNTSGLPAGIYMVSLQSENGAVTQRLIVQ